MPRSAEAGSVHLYRLADGGARLELVHKTPLDGIPAAMCAFRGRLLVGVGTTLRLYDMGRKKLLRKTESRSLPNFIVTLAAQGDRVVRRGRRPGGEGGGKGVCLARRPPLTLPCQQKPVVVSRIFPFHQKNRGGFLNFPFPPIK